MSRPLVHAHFVDLARERLGERGAAMVRDACRGGVHAKALKLAMHCDLRQYRTDDGDDVLSFVMPCAAGMWVGAELQLDTRLPHTVQQILPGRRLGDVVAGCGAEDRTIRAAGDRQDGTRLFLEHRLVDPRRIALAPMQRLRTPFRLLRNVLVLEWQEMAEHTDTQRGWAEFSWFAVQIVLLLCCTTCFLVAGILLPEMGTFGLLVTVTLMAALAWLVSAMSLGFVRHVVAFATRCG